MEHVARMLEDKIHKQLLEVGIFIKRMVCRPTMRASDGVARDRTYLLKVMNWWLVEQDKADHGLCCRRPRPSQG